MKDNWQPFPLPDGSYSDPTRPWSHQDVVNYLPMRAELPGGLSQVNRRTCPGLKLSAYVGTRPVRGMRDVEGRFFVVAGSALYEVRPDGDFYELGTVPGTGLVQMTHNQVTGGNQLVIATGSSGYVYDTRDESIRNPSSPAEDDDGEGTTPGGGAPSDTPGAGGGYEDDAEPDIPLPTVFGSDVIEDGDFTDSGDLDDWKDREGNALSGWTIAGGKAHYNGVGTSTAMYYPARYRMSPHPLPRYSVTVTADASCDAGAKVAVGMYVAYNTGDQLPSVPYLSTPTEHLTETAISYTFLYKQQDTQVTYHNEYVIPNALPVMQVVDESGSAVEADFDNVTMTITEVSTPVTSQTLAHLDFDAGLTGWSVFPVGVGAVTPTASGGVLTLDSTTDTAKFCWVANDDPIDLADALDKYIHIEAEVWSNDPQLQDGVPWAGVALGIIYRNADGFIWSPRLGAYERGDWTAREMWNRQTMPTANLADYKPHLCIGLRCNPGYASKVRNITVEVTDSVIS